MLTNTLIASSGTDLLIASENIAVILITVCNTTEAAVTVNIYAVPNGGTVGNQSKIISSRELRANDSLFLDTSKILLVSGDRIHIVGSTNNSLAAMASYVAI